VNISAGILRIAANANPSTLNVGALGITATGGIIQVGQGMGAFDAVLNLEGDVTASGFFEFTRGNFFGVQRREITLPATRTFNITADETIVNPDIAGLGGLTKTGPGTLSLLGTNSYFGDTTINAGILALNGTLSGSTRVLVNDGGTLAGTGPITFATSGVTVSAGGKLSPGIGLGTLTLTGSSLEISGGADPAAAAAFLFELDAPALSDLVKISGTNTLSIGIGKLEFADFFFTPFPGFSEGTYTLFDGDQPIIGSFGQNRTGPIGNLFGTLAFADGGRDIVLQVVPEPASGTLLVAACAAITGSRRRRQKS
jgi:autotransporter-associated beta strand protein